MIVNKHLAKANSRIFIDWLSVNYPVPGIKIRFQKTPVSTLTVAGVTLSTYGKCKGKSLAITVQKDVTKELTTIAHEWRHSMQSPPKGVPITLGGVQFTYDPEAEKDANEFAEKVVKLFKETL